MTLEPLKRTAIVYDFDGTLAKGNVQEHTFLPELGISPGEFWAEVKRIAQEQDADQILIYMWRLLEEARARGIPVRREFFRRHGSTIPFFAGLPEWFSRIGEYGRTKGLGIEHYVVSSGTHEMIEGCSIADRFEKIFASRFAYDDEGKAVWPALAINYTSKTQFLFRINKGIENSWDDTRINRYMPEPRRPVPFSRMIFLGDGETDIPSMKMVRHQGGHSIAVFDPDRWHEAKTQEHVHRLIAEDRAHFTVPADYREASQLDITVKGVLGRIAYASERVSEGGAV